MRYKPARGYSKGWPRRRPSGGIWPDLRPAQQNAPPPALLDTLPASQAEAYKALRTSLLYTSVDRPPRCLLVTSSNKGEGKSTVSINLAMALAQAGRSVLLVDADLRAPSVGRYLGLPRAPGLVNLIAGGEGDLAACRHVHRFGNFSIDVLTSGVTPPNPSELLGSRRMQEFVTNVCGRYDHVIFDTPPVLAVTDAVVLSRLTDGVILVFAAGSTPSRAPAFLKAQFESVGAGILGCVLNKADTGGYGSRYGAGYYGTH